MKERLFKYIPFGLAGTIVAVLIIATIVGAVAGNDVAQESIYTSPFFIALWAATAITAAIYFLHTPAKRRFPTVILHFALITILAGALLTYTTGERGTLTIHKESTPASMFVTSDGRLAKFPFRLSLQAYEAELHDGSTTPHNYKATLTMNKPGYESETAQLAMNKVYDKDGYRFCLANVGDDCTTLLVAHDIWGTPVTYCGYTLLLFGFIALYMSKRTLLAGLRKQHIATTSTDTKKPYRYILIAATTLLFIYITYQGALQWHAAGLFPVSNAGDAMILVAWSLLLLGLLYYKRSGTLPGTFLLALLCICSATTMGTSQGDVLPILRTPLLKFHVTTIILSYASIALLAVNAIIALGAFYFKRDHDRLQRSALFGRLLLYPATALLIAGIFIGAMWANISWGRYWGWDPKEVWALITLLICSLGFHTQSFPAIKRPLIFHIFCLLAFLAMLFTFFGVNYLLGGLHSYA